MRKIKLQQDKISPSQPKRWLARFSYVAIALVLAFTSVPVSALDPPMDDFYSSNDIPPFFNDEPRCEPGNTDTSKLPVEKQIAQILNVGFDGGQFSKMSAAVQKYNLGAVFINGKIDTSKYKKSNFSSINKSLVSDLLVSSDDEGGDITRFAPGTPSPRSMGGMTNTEVRAEGNKLGTKLSNSGVKLNLAPPLDLNPSGRGSSSRSFSSNPDTVTSKVGSFSAGVTSKNVGVTFKHFPGLTVNTDDNKGVITKSLSSLEQSDIKPYKDLAQTSKSTIMLGNMAVSAWGANTPVSVNTKAVKYIRDKLKFTGPLLTDELELGLKRWGFSRTDAVVKALNAGATMPLITWKSDSDMDALIKAVKDKVSESKIDAAYQVINSYKASLGMKVTEGKSTTDNSQATSVNSSANKKGVVVASAKKTSKPSARLAGIELTKPGSVISMGSKIPYQPLDGKKSLDSLTTAFNYFRGKGLSVELTSAIIGNINQESAGATYKFTRSSYFGLAQWNSSWYDGFLRKANVQGDKNSLGAQLDLIWWQLNNQSPTGSKNVLARMKKESSLLEMTFVFVKYFEGAVNRSMPRGVQHLAERHKYAKQAAKVFGGMTVVNASDGTYGCEGSSDGGGAVAGNAAQTAMNYAWPKEKKLEQKPEYQKAVRDAKSKGWYIGGAGGGVEGNDCGGFITIVMRSSGADSEYNKDKGSTDTQWSYLKNSGKYQEVTAKSSGDLKPGDIGMKNGHTLMYIGDVGKAQGYNSIVQASFGSAEQAYAPQAKASVSYALSEGTYSWYRLKG